ncbi:MAG: hypothetical protein HY699_02735 [Deltaproteobacteria bacterium]|nr:hypothetical protein [Deltaproteobacteria bacterium]
MQQNLTVVDRGVALAGTPSSESTPSVWRRAWEGWKRLAHAIGVVQTRIMMVVFYFIFVFPLGLVLRLVRDPLHLKHPADTNWVPHQQEPATIETARRQF